MRFLSDILAKAGLTVDGVVTLNNTATGQTPNANDNSTKLATTAWVRTFVQPYSLPIASASVLGGIKVGNGLSIDAITGVLTASGGGNVGSFRSKQVFTATASQTTFTVSGGYTPGFIDVFINGVYINDDLYTATNSSTIVLDEAAALDDIITVFIYSPFYVGESPSSRDICIFTATAGQTTFSCSYVIGAVDVYYNGSKLAGSEFNASNGTTIVLNTACDVGDFVEVISWVAGGGLSSSRTITIDGVTQDLTANRTWSVLPTGGAAGDILAKTSATNYDVAWIPNFTSTVQHTVKAAVALTAGQAVYVSSADGTNMIVSKASNASEQTSSKTLGLVAQNLSINGQGFVVTEGLLAGLDTTGANAAGDPVWLGTDGNLLYGLANKPYAPAHLVFIGVVTRRNANNGEIFVKVQNGFEFDELHNLSVKDASDGDMIKYVASTGLWTKIAATTTNIAEGTNLYYTDIRSRAAISLTTSGTSGAATYDNATGVLNIPQYQGGVTSFNTRTGAITLSSSDVTTALGYTPVTNARTLTINGTTYDLSADRSWSIAAGVTSFNTRTGAISLTSLDVTDALTYTPVTNARTLSINGTTYDLTANRSWTVGVNPSAREIQTFTATANQTTFTITDGYVVGLVDVFINGVRLTASDFTATNGTTVVLTTGTGVNNIVDVIKYTSAFIIDNALRQTTYFTATAGQTTFTVSYSPGLVDVFYNGSKLPSSEYTAVNGTSIVLTTPAILNDTIEVTAYNYTAGAFTGQAQLNGTGFVKVSGTTVSYDNSTYLTTSSASSTYQTILTNPVTGTGTTNYLPKFTGSTTIGNSQIFDNGTNVGIGTATPNTKLQIDDSNDVILALRRTINGNAGIKFESTGVNNSRLYGASDSYALRYFYNSNEYLTISATGNVGIGTVSPGQLLTLGGSISPQLSIVSSTTTGSSEIYFGDSAAVYRGAILYDHTSDYLTLHAGAGERMRIASNGKIGINNSVGYNQLDVKGTSTNASTLEGIAGFYRNTTAGGALIIRATDTQADIAATWFSGATDMDLTFTTVPSSGNYFERMRITSGGNIGFGITPAAWGVGANYTGYQFKNASLYVRTSSPELYVNNNAYYNGTNWKYLIGATAAKFELINNEFLFSNVVSGTADANITWVDRMRITSDGKVIVGSSYQTYPVSIEAQSGGGQLALTRSGAVTEFYMGGTTGGATQLYVRSGGSGGVRLDAGATSWVSASDIRLKDIEKPIENAVESLSTLQTIYYSWKDSDNKSLHIGLIAQEVEAVFPEIVSQSSITGMKGVNYTELIPVLVKAIKEQQGVIESLKSRIENLEQV
jgi:hypothetical protein